jgi:hypothetical protein
MQASETIANFFLETMVVLGGGRFRGTQAGFRGRRGIRVEPLVLFDDAAGAHTSTMALPASQVSARAVRAAIKAKSEEFETYDEKVSIRVLGHFSVRP